MRPGVPPSTVMVCWSRTSRGRRAAPASPGGRIPTRPSPEPEPSPGPRRTADAAGLSRGNGPAPVCGGWAGPHPRPSPEPGRPGPRERDSSTCLGYGRTRCGQSSHLERGTSTAVAGGRTGGGTADHRCTRLTTRASPLHWGGFPPAPAEPGPNPRTPQEEPAAHPSCSQQHTHCGQSSHGGAPPGGSWGGTIGLASPPGRTRKQDPQGATAARRRARGTGMHGPTR